VRCFLWFFLSVISEDYVCPSLGWRWTWCKLSWGRRLRVGYNCNGVSYLVICLARIVEVWKSYRGRSWFFTSVELEVFPRKNIVLYPFTFLFISATISFLDSQQTPWSNNSPVYFQKTHKKLPTQFTLSSCVCVLSNLTSGIKAGSQI